MQFLFQKSKETYGRRRMTIAVNKLLNTNYNETRIHRLMIVLYLNCVIRRKRKIYPKVKKDYIAENILKRNFTTTKENQIWSSDITEIPTKEGKLYLSAIIDVNSRKIVSYFLSNRNDNELVFCIFQKVIKQEYYIVQTDRGYQYASFGFKKRLKGSKHSINRQGHFPNNSPIESF